jgi:hypothetical protein
MAERFALLRRHGRYTGDAGRAGSQGMTAAVVSLDAYRAKLSRLKAEGRHYEFINEAGHLLGQVPAESAVRLETIQALARIGLPEVALSLAGQFPAEVAGLPQVAELSAQLRRLPGSHVPWASLRRQFEANLAVLSRRWQAAEELPATWRESQERLRAFVLPDGNHHIARLADDGQWHWLLPLADFRGTAERAAPAHGDETLPPGYVLEGLGYGWYLPKAYADTRQTFHDYNSAVHVIEPDPLTLAMTLHLHDWTDILSDERVYLFWGPDAVQRWAELLTDRLDLPLPKYQLKVTGWNGPLSPPLEGVLKQLKHQRDEYCEQAIADARSVYAERDNVWLRQRFEEAGLADPLRAMCFVSRYTTFLKYSVRDLVEGLRAAGWLVEVVTEPTTHSILLLSAHARAIAEFRPDVLFVVDHLRSEFRDVLPPELVFITWVQDRLTNLLDHEAARKFREGL